MYNKICIHCRYAGLLVVPSHKSISPYIVPDLFDSFLSASCYIVCHVYVLNTHIHKNLDNFFFIYTEKFRPSQHPVDFKSIYFNLSFICNGFLGCSHQGNVLAGGKEWKHITFVSNGSYAPCSFNFPKQKCLQNPWNMSGLGTDLWCKFRFAQLRTL